MELQGSVAAIPDQVAQGSASNRFSEDRSIITVGSVTWSKPVTFVVFPRVYQAVGWPQNR